MLHETTRRLLKLPPLELLKKYNEKLKMGVKSGITGVKNDTKNDFIFFNLFECYIIP